MALDDFEDLRKAAEKMGEVREDLIKDTPTFFKRVKTRIGDILATPIKVSHVFTTLLFMSVFSIVLLTMAVTDNVTIKTDTFIKQKIQEADQSPTIKIGNYYATDLNKMEVTGSKVIILKDKEGKEIGKRYIVKRRYIGNNKVSEFVTIREPIETLNYNKAEYSKYLLTQEATK